MCGIFFCVFKDGQCCEKRIEHLVHNIEPLIRRRGPDDFSTKEKILSDHESGQMYNIILKGAVLHLRGSLTSQPLEDDDGNVLIWNGEVFDGIHIPKDSNDTSLLAQLLGNQLNSPSHVLKVMSCIQGPWSFVYYQPMEGKIWFGRDYFGRRSLVWHLPRDDDDVIAVSSVAQRSDKDKEMSMTWEEVPADGIYCLEPKLHDTTQKQNVEIFKFSTFKLKKYPWTSASMNFDSHDDSFTMKAPVKPFNKDLPTESDLECLDNKYTNERELNLARKNLEFALHLAEQPDTNNTERSLEREALLVHDERSTGSDKQNVQSSSSYNECTTHKHEMGQEGRDVTAFPVSNNQPSQQTSGATSHNIDTLKELCSKVMRSINSHKRTAICRDGGSSAFVVKECNYQIKEMTFDSLPESLISVLGEAVRKRVFNLPRINPNSKKQKLESDSHGLGSTPEKLPCGKDELCGEDSCGKNKILDAKVGILFSGGIDSIVLAALADSFVPTTEPINLINVAFEQKVPKQNPTSKKKPKSNKTEEEESGSRFDVPDRLTGRKGVLELNMINPQRQWNFIEVNVNLKDLQEARSKHITHLVSPLTSVLDDSIGCALWFAARGSGVLRCPTCIMGTTGGYTKCVHPYKYTSVAKVLLVGMGADEQLGGYARHRSKFTQQGWQGLVDEMEMEVNRISERNLGRDDRCISDHGREARFPFLDEQVVSFLSGLPVWLKADLRLPRGTGEKILLRRAAKLLGLTSSAVLPKRAIQFGSRIAKLEGTSEKGSDTCSRLKLT